MVRSAFLAFYRDGRRLKLRERPSPMAGMRWITVGAPSQPGVAIVLTNYICGSPADGDELAALVAKGVMNGVHFQTDDLDAYLRTPGPRLGRGDRAGTGRAAMGHAGLRRTRPVRQPGAYRPAARLVIIARPPAA